jgi:hypothetical protein
VLGPFDHHQAQLAGEAQRLAGEPHGVEHDLAHGALAGEPPDDLSGSVMAGPE